MNRKIILGAICVVGGTFAVGVGCGGSTSDSSLAPSAASAGGTAGSSAGGSSSNAGTSSGAGTSSTAGATATGGASATGGAKATGGASAAGGNTTAGTGGKATAGASPAGGAAGKSAAGGASTGGTNAAGGTAPATGGASNGGTPNGGNPSGGVSNGGTGDLPDAGNPFDADIPDQSLGNDATVATCVDCTGTSCSTQVAQCNSDPQCQQAAACVLTTCAGMGMAGFQCDQKCAADAGITGFGSPAATDLEGVIQCAAASCGAECGAGNFMGGMGPGGMGMGGANGTGGNGTAGTGTTTCNMMSCGMSCGKELAACFQDKTCQPCLKDPMGTGCSTNKNYMAIGTCCSATASCTGCTNICPGLAFC